MELTLMTSRLYSCVVTSRKAALASRTETPQPVAAHGLIPGVVSPLARAHPFPVLPWCILLLKQHLQPLAPAGAESVPHTSACSWI